MSRPIFWLIGGGLVVLAAAAMSNASEREKVLPQKGSVVYCKLAGVAEHSGIYVGDDKIVHLDGSGEIEKVSPKKFLERMFGLNPAATIYVSTRDENSVGFAAVAKRALAMVGKRRAYNLLFDNCHQFTSGCLTGDFENSDNFLWMLKSTAETILGANDWAEWNMG